MTDQNKKARLAGLLYLILVISGIFNLKVIPSKFIVWDNAALTLQNIIDGELLFRFGIVLGVFSFLTFLLLPLALYRLLSEVNKTYAALMVIFAVVSIPLSFVNLLNKFSVLTLISDANYLKGLDVSEIQTQVMFYLESYNNGLELSQVFWGLWLFPFGYLVYKSGFLPKVLGILLMAGCFGYLIKFVGGFLYSDFYDTTFASIVGKPASLGEIGICLWLLIMGTNTIKWRRKAVDAV